MKVGWLKTMMTRGNVSAKALMIACAVSLVVLGLWVRLPIWAEGVEPRWDGERYDALAESIAGGQGFRNADGELNHHDAPVWPLILAALKYVGASSGLAPLLQAAVLGVVVYACTRDLWGSDVAFRALALTMTVPAFLPAERFGYSETFVAAAYFGMVWAAVKSLESPRLTPLAGALAGVVYLSKASLGYTVVLGGLMGLAWRIRMVGLSRILSRDYLWAVAIFGGIASVWIGRNVLTFGLGGWETQPYASEALRALASSSEAPRLLGIAALSMVAWSLVCVVPGVLGSALDSSVRWRTGERSGLILSAVAPAVCALPLIAGFALLETSALEQTTRQIADTSLRYMLVGLPCVAAFAARSELGTWGGLTANGLMWFAAAA